MTSQRQVEANRQNAQQSTGPRTEAGKATSAMNALKHGLTAAAPVLPSEDQEEFRQLRGRLLQDLAPVGAVEERLAEEIVDLSWRLRRASVIEQGVLAWGISSIDYRFFSERKRMFEVTNEDVLMAMIKTPHSDGPLDKVVEITNPDMHEDLTELMDEAIAVTRTEEGRLAEAFIDDAAGPKALPTLGRYETSLFRRRNQGLDMLLALQTARAKADAKETETA